MKKTWKEAVDNDTMGITQKVTPIVWTNQRFAHIIHELQRLFFKIN